MTSYAATPESRINDLALDLYVSAITARDGKLNTEAADDVSARLRSAAADMVFDDDRELLCTAAGAVEMLSTKIKAGAASRTRAKASSGSRPKPPEPDWAALSHAADLEAMASAGSFSVNDHERQEAERAANANAVLAAKRRKLEESRARQIEEDRARDGLTEEERALPWWRR